MGDAGDVIINASDFILLDGASSNDNRTTISSQVGIQTNPSDMNDADSPMDPLAMGDAGDINITTNSLTLTNEAQISAATFGMGDAGDVIINARDFVLLDGASSDDNGTTNRTTISSQVASQMDSSAVGNAGSIDITTNSLTINNGAQLATTTFGMGNSGTITINASDSIFLDGNSSIRTPSRIINGVASEAVGDAQDVTINTGSLTLINGFLISVSTIGQGNGGDVEINATDSVLLDGEFSNGSLSRILSVVSVRPMSNGPGGMGDAGNIEITTNSLNITNGAFISTSTSAMGDAGSINLNANQISLDGVSSRGDSSGIFSAVESDGIGDAGSIDITTNSLNITNGAFISTSTLGVGDAGSIDLNANQISLDGIGSNGDPGGIFSIVGRLMDPTGMGMDSIGMGNAGSIKITTNSLNITDGAQLSTSTLGVGNAGNINLNANQISLDGIGSNGDPGGIFSSIQVIGVGNSEGININTGSLSITNGAIISSSALGEGSAGEVTIKAEDSVILDGVNPNGIFPVLLPQLDLEGSPSAIGSIVGPESIGESGSIYIEAESLVVSNGALLSSSSFGQGASDNVTINARDSINITNQSQVAVGAFGQGDAGTLTLNAGNLISVDNSMVFGSVNEEAVGDAGSVNLTAEQISITNNSEISSSTLGIGNAGNVEIIAPSILLDNNSSLSAVSKGEGSAGNISIEAEQLTIQNGSQAIVSSESFPAGDIEIYSDNLTLDQGTLNAETEAGEDGANINLFISNLLLLRNESLISANASGSADGGNVYIEAQLIFAEPPTGDQGSDIVANATSGDGGTVTIITEGLFGIEFQPLNTSLNDITASSESGAAGIVEILQPNINPAQELVNLGTEVVDATNMIVRSCPTSRADSENFSQFIVTGRGGLPSNPSEVLTSNSIIDGWLTIETRPEAQNYPETEEFNANSRDSISIVEAQGWIISANGKVILTASNNAPFPNFASREAC